MLCMYPMPFWKWTIVKFSTRAHFMRTIATLILGVAAYQALQIGKVDDTWLTLVGMVIGYYFKSADPHPDIEDRNPDDPPRASSTKVD